MLPAITLAALRAYVDLSDPRIQPGGARVAYVRTVRNFAKDRNESAIVVVNVTDGARIVVDRGPLVSSPRWSPDGTRLAYVRGTQIVVARLGRRGVQTVTRAKNGVENYAWSPDGKTFAYVTADDATPGVAHDDLFDVHDDGFLDTSPPVPSHLWLVPSSGGAARRLTHGTWSVFEAAAPFRAARAIRRGRRTAAASSSIATRTATPRRRIAPAPRSWTSRAVRCAR